MVRELLPYASLVVGNEDEFRALADGMQGSSDCQQQEGSYWSESSIADVARRIAASHYVISGAGQDSMKRRLADFHGVSHEPFIREPFDYRVLIYEDRSLYACVTGKDFNSEWTMTNPVEL